MFHRVDSTIFRFNILPAVVFDGVQNGKENTMTPKVENHQPMDEFDSIELGSVSSETKGAAEGPAELSGSQNSRPGIG